MPTPGGASPAAPPPPSGTESPVDASYVDADSPYQAPTQYGQPPPVYYPPPAPSDSRAVVSLVLGLVSVPMMLCCCGPMGASLAVVGLILGLVSMSGPNQGMAIGGVICNGLVLVLTVLIVLLYIVLFVVGQQAGGFGRP